MFGNFQPKIYSQADTGSAGGHERHVPESEFLQKITVPQKIEALLGKMLNKYHHKLRLEQVSDEEFEESVPRAEIVDPTRIFDQLGEEQLESSFWFGYGLGGYPQTYIKNVLQQSNQIFIKLFKTYSTNPPQNLRNHSLLSDLLLKPDESKKPILFNLTDRVEVLERLNHPDINEKFQQLFLLSMLSWEAKVETENMLNYHSSQIYNYVFDRQSGADDTTLAVKSNMSKLLNKVYYYIGLWSRFEHTINLIADELFGEDSETAMNIIKAILHLKVAGVYMKSKVERQDDVFNVLQTLYKKDIQDAEKLLIEMVVKAPLAFPEEVYDIFTIPLIKIKNGILQSANDVLEESLQNKEEIAAWLVNSGYVPSSGVTDDGYTFIIQQVRDYGQSRGMMVVVRREIQARYHTYAGEIPVTYTTGKVYSPVVVREKIESGAWKILK